jgi:hypothetical protein
MTPLIRNTLILSGIWILITIVSWILPGCATPDQRMSRMEYLMDSTIYMMEGGFCDVNYDLCVLKKTGTEAWCYQRLEQCEIAANKRFKDARGTK